MSNLKELSNFIQGPAIKAKFAEILGQKAQGFLTAALTAISQNTLLKDATPESVYQSCMMAASLELSVNPNLGQSYLIPYKNGKTGIVECQWQIGYKGLIQLAQRSGQFKNISASPIYEGEIISQNPLTGFVFDFSKRGTIGQSHKIVGYAGYFSLLNGFEMTLYMTNEEMKSHGLKYSKSFKNGSGVWKDDFDSMAQKTVLKLMLSKYAPLSIQMEKAVLADQSVIRSESEFEYIDNKPLSIEEQNEQAETARILGFIEKASSTEELEMVEGFIDHHSENELSIAFYNKKKELKNGK